MRVCTHRVRELLHQSVPMRRGDRMITLIFHDEAGEDAAHLELTRLKVTGGILWNHLKLGLIASFASGRWKHHAEYYPRVSVVGEACLVFGITRDPTLLSEPISVFSFAGATLRANGVPVAQYIEQRDIWQGLIRPMTWQSMRIVSAATVSAMVDETRVKHFNVWDPLSLRRVRAARTVPLALRGRPNRDPPTRH
jgi:hypothetical protein